MRIPRSPRAPYAKSDRLVSHPQPSARTPETAPPFGRGGRGGSHPDLEVIVVYNRVILIGRTTRDPELRYSPQGHPVTSFTLAVDRPFKNSQGEREADFIDVTVWRKPARPDPCVTEEEV